LLQYQLQIECQLIYTGLNKIKDNQQQ